MKYLLTLICLICTTSFAQEYETWNRSGLPYFYRKTPSKNIEYPAPKTAEYYEATPKEKDRSRFPHSDNWLKLQAKNNWDKADQDAKEKMAKEKELNDLKRFKDLRTMSVNRRQNYRSGRMVERTMGRTWSRFYMPKSAR